MENARGVSLNDYGDLHRLSGTGSPGHQSGDRPVTGWPHECYVSQLCEGGTGKERREHEEGDFRYLGVMLAC